MDPDRILSFEMGAGAVQIFVFDRIHVGGPYSGVPLLKCILNPWTRRLGHFRIAVTGSSFLRENTIKIDARDNRIRALSMED